EEWNVASRDPAHVVDGGPETREDVRDDALQIQELDRRPALLGPDRWPRPVQHDPDSPALASTARRVDTEALPDLERPDERRALAEVGPKRPQEARERRPAELAELAR